MCLDGKVEYERLPINEIGWKLFRTHPDRDSSALRGFFIDGSFSVGNTYHDPHDGPLCIQCGSYGSYCNLVQHSDSFYRRGYHYYRVQDQARRRLLTLVELESFRYLKQYTQPILVRISARSLTAIGHEYLYNEPNNTYLVGVAREIKFEAIEPM